MDGRPYVVNESESFCIYTKILILSFQVPFNEDDAVNPSKGYRLTQLHINTLFISHYYYYYYYYYYYLLLIFLIFLFNFLLFILFLLFFVICCY